MSIRMRPDEDHEGSEFCADYQDRFGKWNPGFHCPSDEGSPDIYCCGTDTYKYCCTKPEVLHPSDIPDLAIVLGILCGTIFALTLIIILSCFFCSCCILYKRRHPTVNGGPLYQMHCSSTGSGVANMYSFSNQNSSATTPIDANGPTGSTIVENVVPEVTMASPLHRTSNSFATVDLIPKIEGDSKDDAPPPYEANVHVISVITEEVPDVHSSDPTQEPTEMLPSTTSGDRIDETAGNPTNEETLYWSTKF